jgi:protein-L-isoaspartate(D-aspartate) O-methyltransferase
MGCNSSKKAPLLATPKATATQQAPSREDAKPEPSKDVPTSKPPILLTDLRSTNGSSETKRVAFATTTSAGELSRSREEEVVDMGETPGKDQDEKLYVQPKKISVANSNMIANLEARGLMRKSNVKEAMLATDRGDYAPSTSGQAAYEDNPLSIGHSATISAPHMHAHALDLLADHLVCGARVLDIGCGSGYVASCMGRMVGSQGLVIGVDHLEPLVNLCIENIRKTDGDMIDSGQLVVLHGDGWKGCPQDTLFDCIHVGAAAETIPTPLLEQLKPGGRMVIPVGKQSQHFYQIDRKADGEYVKTQLMPVRYVPLVSTNIGAACFQPSKKTQEATTAPQQNQLPVACQEADDQKRTEQEELANFEVPVTTVKGANVVQPSDAHELSKLTVKGVPSITPFDARCRWCADACC